MSTADKTRLGKRTVKRGIVEIYSDVLNITFRCPVKDPRAKRLETIVTAHEEIFRQRAKQKRRKHGDTSTLS